MESVRKKISLSTLKKQKPIFKKFLAQQKPKIQSDPIYFASQYQDHKDIEIAAWISSVFAFGNVKSFFPVLSNCFELLGESPYAYFSNTKLRHNPRWNQMYYRWYKSTDILKLLDGISQMIKTHGSLEKHAQSCLDQANSDFMSFVVLYAESWRSVLLDQGSTRGLTFMVPDPQKKSTMKRLLMFLRWMVGRSQPDFGLWSFVEEKHLLIPLDTHMHQFAKQFGWTQDKTPKLATVKQVTDALILLYPSDPMKFDFALTHFGISRACKHQWSQAHCAPCQLKTICSFGQENKQVDPLN